MRLGFLGVDAQAVKTSIIKNTAYLISRIPFLELISRYEWRKCFDIFSYLRLYTVRIYISNNCSLTKCHALQLLIA